MTLPPLVLGTMTFGDTADRAESARIFERAVTEGITWIDTANVYAGGATEEILADLMAGSESLVLATKAGRLSKRSPRSSAKARSAGLASRTSRHGNWPSCVTSRAKSALPIPSRANRSTTHSLAGSTTNMPNSHKPSASKRSSTTPLPADSSRASTGSTNRVTRDDSARHGSPDSTATGIGITACSSQLSR